MRKRLIIAITICLVGSITTGIYTIKKNLINKKEITVEAKKQLPEEINENDEIIIEQPKSNLSDKKTEDKVTETKKTEVESSKKSISENTKPKEQTKSVQNSKSTTKQPIPQQPPKKQVPQAPKQPQKSGIAATKLSQKTNQIIWVSRSKLTFWEKGSDGNWNCSLTTNARIGYGGFTSNKREGDGATPVGAYPILYSFGIGGNPGAKTSYRRITQNSYFVDDTSSKYYNQWYEGTGVKGEHMIDYPVQYKYGMVIGYNTSYIPSKGSAIFLHCNGRGNTAGCVSVDEHSMLTLMKKINGQAYIIITNDDNLKNY